MNDKIIDLSNPSISYIIRGYLVKSKNIVISQKLRILMLFFSTIDNHIIFL